MFLELYKRAMCSDIDRRFPCSIGSALLDCTNNFDTNVIEFKQPEMRADWFRFRERYWIDNLLCKLLFNHIGPFFGRLHVDIVWRQRNPL